jgi:hypothetical protein
MMTYTDIINLALGYSDRQDADVISRMDMFLKIVESRINRYLDTQNMALIVYIPLVAEQHVYQLPTDYLSISTVGFANLNAPISGIPLTLVDVNSQVIELNNNLKDAYHYTIGPNIITVTSLPTSSDTTDWQLKITYYQRIVPLTDTNITNWITEKNPDCYVFGLLTEINAYVKDANTTGLWNERFKECLGEIDAQDYEYKWSGSPIITRVV